MANHTLGNFVHQPRTPLVEQETPLQRLPNLTAHLRGATLFVKRDDCTSLAMGGNKARQLEYYMGDAARHGADTILITGAVQSNFVRLAAAAARKARMDIHVQLEERVPRDDHAYRHSGNVLLDRLFGATIHSYPVGEDESGADLRLEEIAASLRANGRSPYVIHLGMSYPPLGALGYIRAAAELLEQCRCAQVDIDEVVVASGSGQTHAGLLFGLRALGARSRVTGICVRRNREAQADRIAEHCTRIAGMLDIANPVSTGDIVLNDEFLSPGYGQLNPATLEAIRLAARHDALLVDPVYTGKTLAGAMQRVSALDRAANLVFVHTGGTPALFGYEPTLTEAA